MNAPIYIAFDLIILLCMIKLSSSQGLYGFMLNNPISIPSFDSHKSGHAMFQHEPLHASDQYDLERKNGTHPETILIKCKQDSDCIDDNSTDNENLMYCDRHYGFCDFFRKIGELCRHDSQCDSRLICMFGKCDQPFKPGQSGARCHDASECNAGLCCARQHGERICKPNLKLGNQCFVPEGGLDYSLNELCPCDEGLECQKMKAKNKRKRHFKSDIVHRCTKPLISALD